MPTALEALDGLAAAHGERFVTEDRNLLATAVSRATRYVYFLSIIKERYAACATDFHEHQRSMGQVVAQGVQEASPEVLAWYNRQRERSLRLELDIESYYQFVKILLDEVARLIEVYFGSARSRSLASHNKLAKNLLKYCESKCLSPSPKMMEAAEELKAAVDFRDKRIVHEMSPHALRGLLTDGRGGASVVAMKGMTTPSKRPNQSQPLEELHGQVDAYVVMLVDFIEQNTEQTKLRLLPA